ncbi:MAG: hypothetical protein LAP87_29860 [Acidobacteriia bacterium]|nr:hypothetical protein [Terriglobia bacterium]
MPAPVTFRPLVSRRTLLLGSAAALACGRPKPSGFSGYCFVANQGGRSVGVVDLTRFRLRKQIPLDAAPAAVVAHPARPVVFVLAPDAGTVYEIDAASLSVSRRARAGTRAVAMQLAPRNDALWVLYREPAALVEIPLDSLRPARRIRLPAPADHFDLGRENQAAIASLASHSIVVASLASAAIERTIAAGVEPSLVRFQWDGKQVLVGSRPERCLTIFDSASGKTVVRLPLPIAPRNFCFNADGGQLFVTGEGADAVVIVFPYSTEIDQTILAGRAPGAMAVTGTAPFYLLVANPDSNGITVMDVDTRTLVALVQVGQEPRQILLTPDNQWALVLNETSGDVAVIRIFSLAVTPNGAPRRFKSAPLFTLIPVGEKPVSAAILAV